MITEGINSRTIPHKAVSLGINFISIRLPLQLHRKRIDYPVKSWAYSIPRGGAGCVVSVLAAGGASTVGAAQELSARTAADRLTKTSHKTVFIFLASLLSLQAITPVQPKTPKSGTAALRARLNLFFHREGLDHAVENRAEQIPGGFRRSSTDYDALLVGRHKYHAGFTTRLVLFDEVVSRDVVWQG